MNRLEHLSTSVHVHALAGCMMVSACVSCRPREEERIVVKDETAREEPAQTEVATFGAGCFWCVEAVFLELEGVVAVESGYSGGTLLNPTYEQICTGATGHAEVCRIRYDPAKIGYDDLLEVFWKTHDPTTPNRQGNDVGTQYRSVIFYHNQQQKALAERYKRELDASGAFQSPIVTEIVPAAEFYEAEQYHQDYYRNNPQQGYCRVVIGPKLEKFRKVFTDKLKTGD